MKKLLALCFILNLLAACGNSVPADAPPTAAPPTAEAPGDTLARPTATAAPAGDAPGYPAERPTVTPLPAGYPVPTARNPYPADGNFVWMLRPAGKQCATSLDYPDLQTAVDALAAAGVTVNSQSTADLLVCQACDCPTSLHFRAQIAAGDVPTAESLGWSRDQE